MTGRPLMASLRLKLATIKVSTITVNGEWGQSASFGTVTRALFGRSTPGVVF